MDFSTYLSRPVKRQRKSITLQTKIEILNCLDAGNGSTAVGKMFGINEGTIRTIKKNEEAIRKSFHYGSRLSARSTSHTRDVALQKMESALVSWLQDNSQKRIPVDGTSLREAALKFYREIKTAEPECSNDSNRKLEFSASKGWMAGFMRRHSIQNLEVADDTSTPDENAAKIFPNEFAKTIKCGGYSADQVWNLVEIRHFWKRLPSRTYIAKLQDPQHGFKTSCERVTVLICSNASGKCLLKPLLVNRTRRPRSMQGIGLDNLPVYWMANKRSWVTPDLFMEWFQTCFVPEVAVYLMENNLEFKVLLLLDNAQTFPPIPNPNVQFCYMPANTASLIQPLSQGIDTMFKSHYTLRIFQYILDKAKDGLIAVDAWKGYTIKDAIFEIKLALNQLTPTILNNCWRVIWPACSTGTPVVIDNDAVITNIIELGNMIGGEGFSDITSTDIYELVNIKICSKEEPIEIIVDNIMYSENEESDSNSASEKSIQEITKVQEITEEPEDDSFDENTVKTGLDLARDLGNYFMKHDPNGKRARRFQRDLRILIAPYKEIYKDQVKTHNKKAVKSGGNPKFVEELTESISLISNNLQAIRERLGMLAKETSDK